MKWNVLWSTWAWTWAEMAWALSDNLGLKPVQIINRPTQIWQNCCWFFDLVDCINKLLIQQFLRKRIDFTKNVVLFLHAYFLVCFFRFFLWFACCDLPCPRCCHVFLVAECNVLSKVAHKCMQYLYFHDHVPLCVLFLSGVGRHVGPTNLRLRVGFLASNQLRVQLKQIFILQRMLPKNKYVISLPIPFYMDC